MSGRRSSDSGDDDNERSDGQRIADDLPRARSHRGGVKLEIVFVCDVDEAEAITGNPVYAEAAWYDGVRTDCLPSDAALRQLWRSIDA